MSKLARAQRAWHAKSVACKRARIEVSSNSSPCTSMPFMSTASRNARVCERAMVGWDGNTVLKSPERNFRASFHRPGAAVKLARAPDQPPQR